MTQLAIDFDAVRAVGEQAGEACADKAERVADFDRAGAARFILGELRRWGPTSSEDLTESAIAHGFRVHDRRAYGPIYAKLVRDGLIACAGFCARRHGHGTAGGRIWRATQ